MRRKMKRKRKRKSNRKRERKRKRERERGVFLHNPQNALKKYSSPLPLILNVLKKHMFVKRVLFQ